MAERSPQVAVGAIAVVNDALLLIRRGTEPGAGLWSLPGGRVELGETLREALQREMAEETGLEVEVGDLVGWAERIDEHHHYIIFDFAVELLTDDPPRAGDDAIAVAWAPLGTLSTLELVPGLIDFLTQHGVLTSTA